jgi:hypothetical protein
MNAAMFELVGQQADRTGDAGRRVTAHDVAFDEGLLRLLRSRRAGATASIQAVTPRINPGLVRT